MDALSVLQDIAGYAQARTGPVPKFRLATVDPDYDPDDFADATLPKVTFDGESTLSGKTYPVMGPYWPHPGDRVVMAPFLVGGTVKYVILGALDADSSAFLGGGLQVGGDLAVDGSLSFNINTANLTGVLDSARLPADAVSVWWNRSTATVNVTSTSVVGSGFGVAFTAPPSGTVMVWWRDRLAFDKTSGMLRRLISRIEVRTGSSVGVGTSVYTSNDDDAVEIGASVSGTFGMRGNGSSMVRIPGLTPGNAYNVEVAHRLNNTTDTTATSESRSILVMGVR